jgi:signal transduction histidine kinase
MDSVLIHDMKNMGQRLGLLLSNLEEHYGDPEFKRSVAELLNATMEKMDTIVGRFSSHQDAVLIKVPLDLNGVLVEVMRRVKGRTPRAGVKVLNEPGEVPPVWGDPYYLRDAIGSVYQNALEAAAAGGGTVTVRTGSFRQRSKPWAIVELADDGSGMTQEFLRDRLFRPFQTTKENGVGLGLYTARQIVQHHGGDIQVESRLGMGTTVRILIPGAAPSAASPTV